MHTHSFLLTWEHSKILSNLHCVPGGSIYTVGSGLKVVATMSWQLSQLLLLLLSCGCSHHSWQYHGHTGASIIITNSPRACWHRCRCCLGTLFHVVAITSLFFRAWGQHHHCHCLRLQGVGAVVSWAHCSAGDFCDWSCHVKWLMLSFEERTRADEKYECESMCRQVFENNKLGVIYSPLCSTFYTT